MRAESSGPENGSSPRIALGPDASAGTVTGIATTVAQPLPKVRGGSKDASPEPASGRWSCARCSCSTTVAPGGGVNVKVAGSMGSKLTAV
jgi:hypothetical protein